MENQLVSRNKSELIQRFIKLAKKDTFFLGWALLVYQKMHAIDDCSLTQWLECDRKALDRLALCRLPDDKSPIFQDNIRKIAKYGPCNADHLVQLLREVISISSFQGEVL